jgi:hypothetical protein
VAQNRSQHPRVGGEDQVPQRLDEGPLAIDALVQPVLRERLRALDGRVPSASDDVPCSPEPVGVGRSHERAVGVAAVELGVDQRADIDTVDGHVIEVGVDLDPLEPGAPDHRVWK